MRSAALGIAGAVLASGCADGDGGAAREAEFGPEEAAVEADRLYQIVNESMQIESQLQALEQRVARKCMEDQGFVVHAPVLEQEPFQPRPYTDYMVYGPDFAVPAVEDAERWGFGQWIPSVWATGDEDLIAELITPDVESRFDVSAEPSGQAEYEWDTQDQAYQAEWVEAYTGSPAFVSDVKGVEIDGSAELGGCRLEMIETMYGEPVKHQSGGDGEAESWASHPASPALGLELDPGGEAAGWRDVLDGEDTAFLDCIAGRGYEAWDFTDAALNMPLWEYFGRMYEPDSPNWTGEGDGTAAPEAPEDAPSEFGGIMALEIAMATDFAECGQESGLRAAIEYGWALELIDAYRPIETEMAGWQSDMHGHLDNAQDYLGG
ncbi:hypothetical protein GCM10028833_06970 [Glycomyces tarimensis]